MSSLQVKLQKVKQQVITIEKPFNGWAAQKQIQGGVNGAAAYPVEAKDGEYSLSSFINLYRQNFEGHIAPGECLNFMLTDSGGIINQLPVASAVLEQNYAVLANNRVIQFNNLNVGQVNYWDTVGHGGHSAQTSNSQNNDVIASIDLKVTPNLGYIFYSWEDATDGDIGVITRAITGGAYTQTYNWFSALSGSGALQAGVPRKMCLGTDGNLYCTNGQYIAQAILVNLIFASATGLAQKLNLGNGWIANSLTPYQNYLVIVGNRANPSSYGSAQYSRVRVWFWDYASANPLFVFDLNDYSGEAVMVDQMGNLYAFTQGLNAMTTIWIYNGSTFSEKFQTLTASISYPTHNQVDFANGVVNFVGSNSINQWDGNGFHNSAGQVVIATGGPVVAQGFLKNIDTIYMGIQLTSQPSDHGSKYGIFSFINATADITYATGAAFYDQLRVLPYRARIVGIKLYFSQFGSGAKITTSFYQGYDTATDLVNNTLTYNGTPYTDYTIPMNMVMDSFWLKLTFSHTSPTAVAAIVRKAEVIYEPTDFKL